EWLDRYGPMPPPAEALLAVAGLRAECVRTGVREVTVARGTARLTPLELRVSQQVRLQRVARDAVYKEDLQQLIAPLARGADPVLAVLTLLRLLVPDEPAPVASLAP
ncbi:MAG TPA: TRCF domain-containing protein, partial [Acidimicrobiales bacterium]|nr:TRCF domain-containing protein [Acidimicrobiales bacterium]